MEIDPTKNKRKNLWDGDIDPRSITEPTKNIPNFWEGTSVESSQTLNANMKHKQVMGFVPEEERGWAATAADARSFVQLTWVAKERARNGRSEGSGSGV
ncbi:floral homeotic protein DEFICIENS-like [Cucumis melo var. makuwa]|uniref:Floral homeotic protein DEFICIENS-like n=1 Tax=Cucumis melo var. makuwa TaxID=1194695 RepID=A0A5A7TP04_CUCMM|nr:floral homeotic protein DEFICIENS-like [Cucumis melo var. makuwa]TYK02550.1 floral homeotic protein DEFICIENS-like [Cucumis melo var. makuwa]TYK07010.1 floral homeotic protein DEFICIENS-like [Cucumis melo var. makuwa]